MIDTDKVIDIFLNYYSITKESELRLKKLKDDLRYCSPEILLDRFFNGNCKSTLGLCGILGMYEKENEKILNLYKNFMNYYKNFDKPYRDYNTILESKPFFNDKYIYYYKSKKIQKWWKEILYNPDDGIFYKKMKKHFKKLQLGI